MSLLELSPVALLGWPAILIAFVLSVTGVVRVESKWLFIAAVLVTPVSLYLAATPRFRWIALLFPILLFGAGIAVRHSRPWLAWALYVPFVGFFGWLALVVINE